MITDRQVRLLRQKRMEGKTQETAAAKAGMSVRSARKWQRGPLPSATKPEHWWRTRPDPFHGVWEDEIEPLLRNDPTGKLKATTIIDWLAEQYPGRFSASQLRTLQRRLQALRQAQEAGAPRAGSGGVLPPGASAGTGGPVRLHPLRGTQGDHRRTVLPPPAVPADTQPLGVALRRGRRRRDLPGCCSRDCRMPSGPWAAFQRWCAATVAPFRRQTSIRQERRDSPAMRRRRGLPVSLRTGGALMRAKEMPVGSRPTGVSTKPCDGLWS